MVKKQIKYVEYAKLKFAYETVKDFIENESGDKVKCLNSRIAKDLGINGDDNYDLLEKFINKFELNFQGFQYHKHFYSENELTNPEIALERLLTLSVWLPLKTLELLTFNKVRINKPEFPTPEREVSDMTFKDLLTCYIEGKYTTSEEIEYRKE